MYWNTLGTGIIRRWYWDESSLERGLNFFLVEWGPPANHFPAHQALEKFPGHDLHRHIAVQVELPGLVDLTFSASGDKAQDLPFSGDNLAFFENLIVW